MARRYIDCREYPSENKCSIAISADTDEELLTAAVQHACACHGYTDTAEFRSQLRTMFKTEEPGTEERRAA